MTSAQASTSLAATDSLTHPAARFHRIRAGISLDDICQATKISRHFLEAIEERAYQRLPGGIFDVCYIRQYAEQIGFRADELLADYNRVVCLTERVSEPSFGATNVARAWWRVVF